MAGQLVACWRCTAPNGFAAPSCAYCGQPFTPVPAMYSQPAARSRVLAALLAILLGGVGVHKFYTGKVVLGIVYLVFFWTFIPAIVGFFEGLWYLTLSDEGFRRLFP